jgi:hypothetical protein
MTITTVHSFDVDAEILGVLRRVSWSVGVLTITGLSHSSALHVLAALGTGSLANVQRQAAESVGLASPPPTPPEDPVQTGRRVGEEMGARARKRREGAPSAESAPPAPSGGSPPAPAAPPVVTAPPVAPETAPSGAPATPPAALAPSPQAPLPPAAPPTPAAVAAPPATPPPVAPPPPAPAPRSPAPAGRYDLEVLRRASTVRAVISHLMEHGVAAAGLVDACASIKEEVPVLSRIANLPERIVRACEVMGLNGAAQAE